MLRLAVIGAMATGFVLGMKAERHVAAGRCLDSSGSLDDRGVCIGAEP